MFMRKAVERIKAEPLEKLPALDEKDYDKNRDDSPVPPEEKPKKVEEVPA